MIHVTQVHAISQAPSAQGLSATHQELLECMAALEAETAKHAPDKAAIASARMRLMQASRKRGAILDSIVASEMRTRTGTALGALLGFTEKVRKARAISTAHISKWTPAALEANWRGYCVESAILRKQMRRQIQVETQFFLETGTGPGSPPNCLHS